MGRERLHRRGSSLSPPPGWGFGIPASVEPWTPLISPVRLERGSTGTTWNSSATWRTTCRGPPETSMYRDVDLALYTLARSADLLDRARALSHGYGP